ncbi:calcium-binding protein [Dankookia sp. GCM10030260]|uniref:calcium-binding protein n=1 Tax=Dankookia sp. GCM10030260 TaxID=3273390 RepID=UPI00361152BE
MADSPLPGWLQADLYFDLDGNGVRDLGDPTLPGHVDVVSAAGDVVHDGPADAILAALPAGTYSLYLFGSAGAAQRLGPFEVRPGTITVADQGFRPAYVDIVTYVDANGDDGFQPGEEYAWALEPEVFSWDGSFRTSGFSSGPLLPGEYGVIHNTHAWPGPWMLGGAFLAQGDAVTIHVQAPTPTVTYLDVAENSSTWVGAVSFRRGGGTVTGPYLREEPELFGPAYYFEPGHANGTFTIESTWWTDGFPPSPPSQVIITVIPSPDPPVARDDAGFQVLAGQTLRIPVASLLANDTDADGDRLSLVAVGGAGGGTVRLAGAEVLFTAAADGGPAQFQYTVADPSGLAATGHVMLLVDPAGTPGADLLVGFAGADHILGLAGADTIAGHDGADTLDGGSGADLLSGDAGDDVLTGGEGDDRLAGGAGKDSLRGGAGIDRATGGAGNDTFVFHKGDLAIGAQHGGQRDHVVDFHGAGGYLAWSGVEDDFLAFFGFGAGAWLEWLKDAGNDPHLPIYGLHDGDGAIVGEILVQSADSTVRLAAGDYKFFA